MKNICEICHKKGNGCCNFKDNDEAVQIGILKDDIELIINHLGIKIDDFIIIDNVNAGFVESISMKIHPVFSKIFFNNIRYKLKTIDNRCVFQSDSGCKLPNEIRPIYCRLYPFWLSRDNRYINVLSSVKCLAQAKTTLSWVIVNENFGYSETYIRELFAELERRAERHIL